MKGEAKKILCIEDDAFLLNLIAEKFAHAGITAIGAHTGLEGVLLAKDHHPDLVLLDLMLPDTSGLEILKELTIGEKTKHIPVIIFSNLGDRAEIEKGIALGARAYLVKSNTLPSELVDIVSGALGLGER